MCQPADKGGKRCLRHSAASNAEVRFTFAKTNATHDTIYGILKQLNKEGRKMDAPELAEVNAFLDKEEFKVKLDPDLTERDRKLILKNLEKARQEAEKQGVTGGAFHAWKNVFKKTVESMKKPLFGLVATGAVLVALTGCTSGALHNTNGATNAPTPSGTPVAACSTPNATKLGDVVPLKEVKDSYGEYCQTTINPNSSALKYDASKVDTASLAKYGFTEADAKEAQKNALNFYSQEFLDSSRLDNSTVSDMSWYKQNENLFNPTDQKIYADVISKKPNALRAYGIIVADALPDNIVRNGGPRATSTAIQLNKVYAAKTSANLPAFLVVDVSSTSSYNPSNAAIVSDYLKHNPTKTKAELQASNPELFDSNQVNALLLTSHTLLSFYKGNMTQIAGSSANYSVTTAANGLVVGGTN